MYESIESFLSEPHFLHFISLPLLPPVSSVFFFQSDSRAAWQAYSSELGAAQQPPCLLQINFLLKNGCFVRPLISHLSHTHQQGRSDFFSDFLVHPQMLICIVESDGQGKRLQPCRFLCLLSLLTVSVCVAGAPTRQQAALRRTGTHTLT